MKKKQSQVELFHDKIVKSSLTIALLLRADSRNWKFSEMIWKILRFFPLQTLKSDLRSGVLHNFIHFTKLLKISCSNLNQINIAKKFFLNRYCGNMSLQFEVVEHPRSLVSLSYASSEEDMEVDSVTSVQDLLDRESEDTQVLACYYENPPFPPQLAAGRAMTTDLTQCLNDLNLPSEAFVGNADTFTEPPVS